MEGQPMSEWLMILAVLWSAGLFAAGGTDLNGKGHKWLRRFLMPAGLAGLASLYAPWWACVGYGLTTSAVLHLGYGERASWLKRAFIFIGYGATSLWFGLSWWVLVTPVVLLGVFFLSNIELTRKSFPWKIWEMGAGFLIAAGLTAALLNQWRGL